MKRISKLALSGETGQWNDVRLGNVFDRHAIQFYGRIARRNGLLNSAEHSSQLVPPCDLAEAFAIERIEVHVQSTQAGIVKCFCLARQENAVGGECQFL